MAVRCACLRVTVLCLVAFLAGCRPADREDTADSALDPGVIDVTARDFAFEAPAEIPSGWTTFRMRNEGAQHHFLVLWRLPEGKMLEDYVNEVGAAFDTLHMAYRAGEMSRDEMMGALGAAIPGWFADVQGMGGPGLTAPGRASRTTVNLVPGTYVMECYVKTPDGQFHSALGMMRQLTVSADSTGVTPPEADVEIGLANYEFVIEGELTPGEHTVRARVLEQPEGLLGHDVHLVRLESDTPLQDVVAWMDWVDALKDPPPAIFVGGAEQVPPGQSSYFTVTLEPGRYAWISEEYGPRGMVQEFSVE